MERNVLIESFEGQNCINCPKAKDVIHSIQEIHSEQRVIAVTIHGRFLSIHESKNGLATDCGDEYVKFWGVDRFPVGLIDRTKGLHDYPSWNTLVSERIQLLSPIKLEINKQHKEKSNSVDIEISISSNTDISAKLQIWLVESNIKSLQMTPSGSLDTNYIHNHVFRAAVNGTWGETMDQRKNLRVEFINSYLCLQIYRYGVKWLSPSSS